MGCDRWMVLQRPGDGCSPQDASLWSVVVVENARLTGRDPVLAGKKRDVSMAAGGKVVVLVRVSSATPLLLR